MRTELLKVLRKSFEKELTRLSGHFVRVTKPGMYYWRDEWVFENNQHPKITFVIILSPNPNGSDSFSVELGWSKKKRLPELSKRPSSINPRTVEGDLEEYVTRLSYLKNPTSDFYYFNSAVDLCVEDLISDLIKNSSPISGEQAQLIARPVLKILINDLEHIGLRYLDECCDFIVDGSISNGNL